MEETSGKKTVKSRSAVIGTGTLDPKPSNARTAGDREEEEDPFESDDEEAERAANRQRHA